MTNQTTAKKVLTKQVNSVGLDSRIACDYSQLVRLQSHASAVSLLPSLLGRTALSGRHQSKLRGRGLNFEELKQYQHGDDIRNLDWKVTLRTGKPYVRSYSEEKDRNVVICVDLRSSMFFSTTSVMKSVVAAEVLSLLSWGTLKQGDRVNCMLLSDDKIRYVKVARNRNALLSLLKIVSQESQNLTQLGTHSSDKKTLADAMKAMSRIQPRNATVVFISDWHDATEADLKQANQLQRHNDVIPVIVKDPFESEIPDAISMSTWLVGDGEHQFTLQGKGQRDRVNQAFKQQQTQTDRHLGRLTNSKSLPVITLDTYGEHLNQLIQQLGGR